MGMTMTEKILAFHAGIDETKPGQLIEARCDMVLANDITAPIAIREFLKIGRERVWNGRRIALVPDHFTPNKDIKSAEQAKLVREFAKKFGIKNYFEIGEMGIEHALLPEKGLVLPGDLVIGADSHTCTYGALGAFSTGVGSTDLASAMASGTAWFKVPESILVELSGKLSRYSSGKDVILKIIGDIGVDGARYMAMEFTGDGIRSLSMDNRFTIANMAIEAGAKNGIFPVDDAMREGYIEVFIEAGGAVSTPTCGPCLGGHMGVLAEGEKAVATTNRNFVGRMGHKQSEVYLASPAVAAASAVLGKISSPEELAS